MDQLRNYESFFKNAPAINDYMSHVFNDPDEIKTLTHVTNGLSHVTEDIVIAQHILNKGFPVDFTESNNANEDGNPDQKFESLNISQNYLNYY